MSSLPIDAQNLTYAQYAAALIAAHIAAFRPTVHPTLAADEAAARANALAERMSAVVTAKPRQETTPERMPPVPQYAHLSLAECDECS